MIQSCTRRREALTVHMLMNLVCMQDLQQLGTRIYPAVIGRSPHLPFWDYPALVGSSSELQVPSSEVGLVYNWSHTHFYLGIWHLDDRLSPARSRRSLKPR